MAATKKKRQPAQLEMVGGKGSRQRAWEAIRKHAGAFTCYQIARKAKVDMETLLTYLRSLQKGGYLAADAAGSEVYGADKVWELVRDNGLEAPRLTRDGRPVTQGMGTEAMWRSMRIIGEFNARELAAHASVSVSVAEVTAKTYLLALHRAGYLTLVKPANAGRNATPGRYRLAAGKYTGPRPPMIQRTKSVYDPNLNEVVWTEVAKHDDDL
ncbi:hypothetical protein [Massilia sp. NR 4-1]|uniref:hypothetical protein n=1 Tax=Massilia sp. NR 4-1 TaxID=1678028 RepID=UPI00067C60B6|nr:hypothetical protein [Massilia sp. NR 4-1]AKU21900.1 hypothetical protein ACZ75_10890 [Massilia sp. NR 4-1]